MTSTLAVVVTALASALAAATSSVLQHRSARRTSPTAARTGVMLVVHLATQPLWLLGTLAALVGLALHVAALDGGRLTLVQPLLVSGLLFALPLSVLLEGRRPSLVEWAWAVVVMVGLSVFLVVANPHSGTAPAPTSTLVVTTVAGCGVMVLLWLGARIQELAGPVLIASAGGIGFGITSALLKQCAAVASGGPAALLSSWALYGVLLVGAAAITLTQVAYRSAPLASSLPAMTVADPAAAVVIGVVAFHEQVGHTLLGLAAEVGAFVLMTVGTWQLARHAEHDNGLEPVATNGGASGPESAAS